MKAKNYNVTYVDNDNTISNSKIRKKPYQPTDPNLVSKKSTPKREYKNSKKTTTNSIVSRISPNVEHIDTGDYKTGIIRNPFKDEVTISGADIKEMKVFFDDIHSKIIKTISQLYHRFGKENVYILGCIAWLSDPMLIQVLSEAAGIQILVNDEDFTRWGGKTGLVLYPTLPRIKVPFRVLFNKCSNPLLKTLDPIPLEPMDDYATASSSSLHPFTKLFNLFRSETVTPIEPSDHYYAAIRVIGSRPNQEEEDYTEEIPLDMDEDQIKTTIASPSKQKSNFSLFQGGSILHSKFLIPAVWYGNGSPFQPIGAFTGSMNWTKNSRKNQENVVWIEGRKVGEAFLDDYVRSFQASKPMRK